MRRLELRAEAESDVLAAALYYEGERAGLGFRFEAELNRTFTHMAEMPLSFAEIAPGVHRALLRTFPYGIFFAIEPELVIVLAVLHLHRHPDRWKERR